MMNSSFEKHLYAILGVAPHATQEEIRAAYLSRARILHPDRFNYKQQPQEWKKANDRLAEVNEAYAILKNASDRVHYDAYRTERKQQRQAQPSPATGQQESSSTPFEHEAPTHGYAFFGDLPKNVQSRLMKRQQNDNENQFQVKLASVLRNYVFIVALLAWFVYLFANVDTIRWKVGTVYWYAGITFVVGALIGRNCVTIHRWRKATLKPCFYITPLYFIWTCYDMILFWPLWMLKDVKVTHNYSNGSYQSSTVVFTFGDRNHTVTLPSKGWVDLMFGRLRTYDTQLRAAISNRDYNYVFENDDFYNVPRSERRMVDLLSKGKRALIYGMALVLCGGGLFGAILVNEEFSTRPWNKNYVAEAGKSSFTTSPHALSPTHTIQALPRSGSTQMFSKAQCIAPFEIKAAQGNHYLVKLVNVHIDLCVLTVFVRSGSTVTIDVPLGTYEVRYATGETWYGHKYLFGKDTVYSKADEIFTFEVVGNQISGYTITLYQVVNGNLTTSRISPNEF